MRGIAIIDDDIYYERVDGTYAKMPYGDGEAMANIFIERATREELEGLTKAMAEIVCKHDPELAAELLSALE
ncbi:hypothetical protein ABT255_52655 [Streptomyces mirabilis]|uniref:hypothetical protein n=1 Tax=Streptomyces mirabilis TaxID=68239 RepID=UPI0033171531